MFAPHKLQKWIPSPTQRDNNGDVIVSENSGDWVDLGVCRCDDAGNKTLYSQDGIAYNPLFKIVCPFHIEIGKGDKLRAIKEDDVIGVGNVDRVVRCNYLQYQTVWLT